MQFQGRQKKYKKNQTRLNVLRNMMSSFAMTVGVVVVIVMQIPKSPVASILNVNVFENLIAFEVSVTDEDHALDLSSLKVVLENQFNTYSVPIDLGQSSGVFENLDSNTTYYLQVYGSKGYGDERLASTYVKTKPNDEAVILSYDILEVFEFSLTYDVRVWVGDIDQYESIDLYYGVGFMSEEPQFYESFPITLQDQTFTLLGIENYHSTVSLYIEGKKIGEESKILDQVSFDTPFILSSSFYLERIDKDRVDFLLYGDYYLTDDITYQAKLYKNDILIEQKRISSNDAGMEQEMKFFFDGLKKLTDYKVEVIATYINPQTLREETLALEPLTFTTIGDYTLTYIITEEIDYLDVYIELYDPNHYYQIPYYAIYEPSEFHEMVYIYETFDFSPDGLNKYVNFQIPYPILSEYRIEIGIYNQTNYLINHIIYDEMMKP